MKPQQKPFYNNQGRQQQQQQAQAPVAEKQPEVVEEAVVEQPLAEEVVTQPLVEEVVTQPLEEKKVTQPVAKPVEAPKQVSKPQPQSQPQGFVPVKTVQFDLESFKEAMDPKKPINPEEGGKWQYSLFVTIRSMFSSKTQEEFNQKWNTLLVDVQKNREGVFSENFAFRFAPNWPGNTNEYTNYRRLLVLAMLTCDPKTRRKEYSAMSMDKVCELLTEQQRQMLLNFYEV